MLKPVKLIIFLILMQTASAQDTTYILQGQIGEEVSFFTTDHLGNSYVVDEKNELTKYDPSGIKIASYGLKIGGKPASVNVTNPMKVTLYYPQFYQVIILDNRLSEIAALRIDPAKVNGYISLIAPANDNTFWAFEETGRRLLRLDKNLSVLYDGSDLYQVRGQMVKPDYILEHEGAVFLNDSASGILQFDTYGAYIRTIPIKGLHDFQAFDDELIYFSEGRLKAFHTLTMKERNITLPAPADQVRLGNRQLFHLAKNRLFLYAF